MSARALAGVRSDDALRAMAARGDPEAFGELYERHRHALYRYCQSILGHDDDARDALHNAMAKAWAAIGHADPDVPLRPWLFRIVHNEALNLLRARRDHRPLNDAHVSGAASLDETIDLRQRLAALRADLAALPERQRSALLLRELCGLRHDEIAAVLATTTAAARQTIYEARVGLHEAEVGRGMACAAVQRALSDGDGSVRRRRRIRGHLRACPACSSFEEALRRRPNELGGLAAPLPAPPLGLLARLLSHVGASEGPHALTTLSSGLAANLAVGSVVVTVSGVATLQSPAKVEPAGPAPAAIATALPSRVSGGVAPHRRAERRHLHSRHAGEPAKPMHDAPARHRRPASAPASVAVPAPSEEPAAVPAQADATAADPVVVADANVEVDPQSAPPPQPTAPGPIPSARPSGAASTPASEPAPTPPASEPDERTSRTAAEQPQPARPAVAQPDRGPQSGAPPDRRPSDAPNDPRPPRTPADPADRRPPNDRAKEAQPPTPADGAAPTGRDPGPPPRSGGPGRP